MEFFATTVNEARSISATKGIRLSYLMNEFVDECGGRDALQGLATKDVFEQFILPTITKESKLNLLRNPSEIHPKRVFWKISTYKMYFSSSYQKNVNFPTAI